MSHQKMQLATCCISTVWYHFWQWGSIPSISSLQTVKQIEVIQEVVSPDVSNLNDAVMNKKQGDHIQCSPEKRLIITCHPQQHHHSG